MPIVGKELSKDYVWGWHAEGKGLSIYLAPANICFGPDNALQSCHLFDDEKKL